MLAKVIFLPFFFFSFFAIPLPFLFASGLTFFFFFVRPFASACTHHRGETWNKL